MERGPNTLSNAGITTLVKLEGLRLERYTDIAGHDTIGVGHLILDKDHNLKQVTGMDSMMVRELTEKQAMDLLFRDLDIFETHITTSFDFNLPQQIFDALVLFCFNLGRKAFDSASFIPYIENKEYLKAAKIMLQYNKVSYMNNGKKSYRTSPGLLKRRFVEIGIMAYPFLPTSKPEELSKPLYDNGLDLILEYYQNLSNSK